MKYFYALIIFTFIIVQHAFATHLVGGEMTYVRLSGNTIRVTLTVYRDNINGQAAFDSDNSAPNAADCVISFYNDNGTFLEAITIDLDNISLYEPTLQPCQDEIPNIETQEGTYTFDINLNNINGYNPAQGVTLVYGRCCRNSNINNLSNPGDQGFSAIVRVPPASIINNSPTFDSFEQYLCAGRQNTIDFSATDIDGDSLYYHLCDPYQGLSSNDPAADMFTLNGGGTYFNYGPPYNTINWGAGYTASNPFGGTTTLNPNTGILTATPPNTGVYVMQVCVSEYRNGVLLSTVSRDFQYLVSPCDFPDISIQTDPNIPQDGLTGLYTIDADCNEGLIQFHLANNIDIVSYSWNFGDPSTTSDVSTLAQPSYYYSDTGTYVVTVIGYAADGCADTSRGLVVFYPIFEPGYTFIDSCLNLAVQFTDTSYSTTGNLNSWTWNFGDPGSNSDTSHVKNPNYVYSQAGTFTASLVVTTDKGCIDTVYNQITIHPLPEPSFTPSNPRCVGEPITLNNTSQIQSGSITNYNWLVDGQTFTTQNVNYTFNNAGTFPIQLFETSNKGCMDTIVQNVTINPLPTLTVSAQSPVCPKSNSQLNAVSSGNQFTWTPVSMLSNANIANPVATMDTTPTWFYVEVSDNNGCQSNDSVFVDLFPLPDADAGPDTSVCLNAANVISFNTTVQLQASGGVSYLWSPAAGLSSTTISNPTASPTTTTDYAVRVTDINTCVNYDTVKVVVLNPALELIQVDVDSMCNGDTVYVEVIDLGNVTSYTWLPINFVTDPSIREPGFFPPSTTDYTLQTVNYCYLDEDTIKIEVVSPPPVDAGPLDSICLGDAPYMLDAQPNTLALYQWTTTDASISDPSIPNPTIAPTQNTWYYVYAVDSIGTLACESNDSVQILVFEPPTLALHYPLDYPGYICLGDSVQLYASSNDGIYFDWSSNNGAVILSPSNDTTLVVPTDTTIFYQTVTNVHACSTSDSIEVAVQLPVTAMVSGDSSMCVGTYANVAASGGFYYQWYPQQTGLFSNYTNSNTQVYPDSTITIFVDVSNDCFNDTAYHTITVYQLPTVDAGDDITINRDESDFLYGAGSGEPLWYTEDKTFEGILDLPNNYTIEVSPFNTTSYVLEVTDSITGCQNYDTAIVHVNVLTLLAFPTGFSPNGNGTNDFAHIIKYLNIKQLNYLSIFDRWGELVYTSQELDATGWDGTFKGRECEVGTYIWVISAVTKDDENILRKGNITLIR